MIDRQAEISEKVRNIRRWLDESELGGVLLNSQPNFAWLTAGGHNHVSIGDSGGVASLLVTPDREYLLANNIELGRLLAEEVEGLPFEAVSW